MQSLQSVLFDLDGTLVDTAPDLGNALNQLLSAHNRPTLETQAIRPYASHGSVGLIRFGFGVQPTDEQFEALKNEFLALYAAQVCRASTLFEHMEDVLRHLEHHQIPWGIVTNKPQFLTDPLLRCLKLTHRAACVISGDTTVHRKPHPEPLLHALRQLGVEAENTLYVGDAERDIEAARRAGIPALVATYGYLSHADKPETWGATELMHSPQQLLQWLHTRI